MTGTIIGSFIKGPNIALNLACYDWAVASLRQFFMEIIP